MHTAFQIGGSKICLGPIHEATDPGLPAAHLYLPLPWVLGYIQECMYGMFIALKFWEEFCPFTIPTQLVIASNEAHSSFQYNIRQF